MPENGDRDLTRLFSELRRSDAASTPSFRSVLERPRGNRAAGPAAVPLLTAVAIIVTALASVFLLRERSRSPEPKTPAISLAQWTSPTDSLLRFSGSELLEQPPPLIESAPGWDFERSSRSARPTPTKADTSTRTRGERT